MVLGGWRWMEAHFGWMEAQFGWLEAHFGWMEADFWMDGGSLWVDGGSLLEGRLEAHRWIAGGSRTPLQPTRWKPGAI